MNPPPIAMAVVEPKNQQLDPLYWRRLLPALIVSGGFHVVMLAALVVLFFHMSVYADTKIESTIVETRIDEELPTPNLENEEVGLDPEVLTNYNVPRIEDISVPGPVNPDDKVGIDEADPGPERTLPPPPGFGNGTGGSPMGSNPEFGNMFGLPGGMSGPKLLPGGFGGRSGATREQMVREGGGNARSEAAVASGLRWLALHQSSDGRWSLHDFPKHAKDCNCTNASSIKNDVAGTALGLLPFLGAGFTHKVNDEDAANSKYASTVEKGLKFLVKQQDKDGGFAGTDHTGMYAHGIAAITLCEAYAMTKDRALKAPAQKAIKFIISAQGQEGGWRYRPRQGGDTSVVGWQVMAVRSAKMAGLLDTEELYEGYKRAMEGTEKWLNSVHQGGGYGYVNANNPSPTMTSVGLLCRQYQGWGPRHKDLRKGIDPGQPYSLMNNLPGSKGRSNGMYYLYYATQVIHHVGGKDWETWNPKIRDMLIESQDQGQQILHQKGSWGSEGQGLMAGRLMQTSLCILTLEVYYRHLPLYSRKIGDE